MPDKVDIFTLFSIILILQFFDTDESSESVCYFIFFKLCRVKEADRVVCKKLVKNPLEYYIFIVRFTDYISVWFSFVFSVL